jgi:hypothetical protein
MYATALFPVIQPPSTISILPVQTTRPADDYRTTGDRTSAAVDAALNLVTIRSSRVAPSAVVLTVQPSEALTGCEVASPLATDASVRNTLMPLDDPHAILYTDHRSCGRHNESPGAFPVLVPDTSRWCDERRVSAGPPTDTPMPSPTKTASIGKIRRRTFPQRTFGTADATCP